MKNTTTHVRATRSGKEELPCRATRREPRPSPEPGGPGAPRGCPCAASGRAAAMEGPAQSLKAQPALPQHPTASSRHGDPAVPPGAATAQTRSNRPRPRAEARPPSRMRRLDPFKDATAVPLAPRSALLVLPEPPSFPRPRRSNAKDDRR
jgi:hypothetical protein